MRKSMLFVLLGLLLNITVITAQETPVSMINAFKKGSADELSAYLGSKVELVLLNTTKEYSKQGAQQAMADFFSANKVSAFALNHQGQRDESGFMVGTLTTNVGVFRVNCFFKKVENQYLIYQIRIDKNK